MNKVLIVILLLSISGCSIPRWHIDRAVKFCDDKGGIHHIDTFVVNSVICTDGSSIALTIKEDDKDTRR